MSNSAISSPHRCAWVGQDELYIQYHDCEWGIPVRDDELLFQHLLLDGFQAGLSWITILKKRENYRVAFDNFNPQLMAAYGDQKIAALMQNAGIVRNRLKIQAAVKNAEAFLELQAREGSFATYLWGFVGGQPIQNTWATLADVPTETPESRAMSKDLKQRGFKFVGPTICYAFMQATGLVNDHTTDCFRHQELAV
ncbi:MAG: DNA-3-methyladenine glycosylase I [Cyanobacteria bacterium P01_A01_bin.123]